MSQLQFMDQQRLHYPVQVLCQALGVMPSRCYAWRKGVAAGAVAPVEPAWETVRVDVFDDYQRRYGTRRLQVKLQAVGRRVGRQAIRTALRRQERKALQPKAFVPHTTTPPPGKRGAPNLLLDQSRPAQDNRLWVSDIMRLPLTNDSWVYGCAFVGCVRQAGGGHGAAAALSRCEQRPLPG